MTYQGPAPDLRRAMFDRRDLILADIDAAWSRFTVNHRNARVFATPHDLMTKDLSSPDALTYWRRLWPGIERRIWLKHEQAAYRELGTPVVCPNPACRHRDCQRTDVYCPMCGNPHTDNITRGNVKPARPAA